MMILQETYELNNGVQIPKLGFGTWQIPEEQVAVPVLQAVKAGYRHIDTAAAYGNEKGVGAAIRDCGVAREKLFITTKIPAEVKSYAEAKQVIADSLENLGVSYIDLMLIHAPKPWSEMGDPDSYRYTKENVEVYRALEEAYEAGQLRAIGVSNFNEADLDNILANCRVKPAVNQIQVNIAYTQYPLVRYCQEKGLLVMAYSPNATGRMLQNAVALHMAEKYQVSVAQLCIRFDLQLGTAPIPKTTHEAYIIQNAQVDFAISEEDMQILLAVGE